MTRTLDDSTQASHPGAVRLSHEKLKKLRPDLYGFRYIFLWILIKIVRGVPQKVYIEEALFNGDSRAAVVVSTSPLLVAAYTDELDCVAILQFPNEFATEYSLSVGSRLLTINTYGEGGTYSADLTIGPGNSGNWTRFHPLIADFLSNDTDRIGARKREITEDEWSRAAALGNAYLKEKPGVARTGKPYYSMFAPGE